MKNINLRIKPDLNVCVSANTRVSVKYIDSFVLSKAEFILSSLEKFRAQKKIEAQANYSVEELYSLAIDLFEQAFRQFSEIYKIKKPQLKFRKMKSRWGSCNYKDGKITLSTNLVFCDERQIRYVIFHELSHLIVPNHDREFYAVVEEFCPDCKEIRKEMNNIVL